MKNATEFINSNFLPIPILSASPENVQLPTGGCQADLLRRRLGAQFVALAPPESRSADGGLRSRPIIIAIDRFQPTQSVAADCLLVCSPAEPKPNGAMSAIQRRFTPVQPSQWLPAASKGATRRRVFQADANLECQPATGDGSANWFAALVSNCNRPGWCC